MAEDNWLAERLEEAHEALIAQERSIGELERKQRTICRVIAETYTAVTGEKVSVGEIMLGPAKYISEIKIKAMVAVSNEKIIRTYEEAIQIYKKIIQSMKRGETDERFGG